MSEIRKRYKRVYERRALNHVEENDPLRPSRIPYYRRYCLPQLNGGFILDVGAADGALIRNLGERTIGCDISIHYCRKMRKAGLNVMHCVAEYLPFRSNSFSTVFATAVLEHVLTVEPVLSELSRVVKAEGLLLISVPYKENLKPYHHCKYEFSHLRAFDDQSLKSLFKKCFSLKEAHFHDFIVGNIKVRSCLLNKISCLIYKVLRRIHLEPLLMKFYVKPCTVSLVLVNHIMVDTPIHMPFPK